MKAEFLPTFVGVVQEGSFSGTARKRAVTPSAVGTTIRPVFTFYGPFRAQVPRLSPSRKRLWRRLERPTLGTDVLINFPSDLVADE